MTKAGVQGRAERATGIPKVFLKLVRVTRSNNGLQGEPSGRNYRCKGTASKLQRRKKLSLLGPTHVRGGEEPTDSVKERTVGVMIPTAKKPQKKSREGKKIRAGVVHDPLRGLSKALTQPCGGVGFEVGVKEPAPPKENHYPRSLSA